MNLQSKWFLYFGSRDSEQNNDNFVWYYRHSQRRAARPPTAARTVARIDHAARRAVRDSLHRKKRAPLNFHQVSSSQPPMTRSVIVTFFCRQFVPSQFPKRSVKSRENVQQSSVRPAPRFLARHYINMFRMHADPLSTINNLWNDVPTKVPVSVYIPGLRFAYAPKLTIYDTMPFFFLIYPHYTNSRHEVVFTFKIPDIIHHPPVEILRV